MEASSQDLRVPLLSDADQDALRPVAHTLAYPKGTVLARAGEHSDHVLYLRSGHLKSCVRASRRILGLHGPGSVIGELASLTGEPRSADIVALTNVEVLHIPGDVFLELLQSQPRIHLSLIRRLAKRIRDLGEEQEDSWPSNERRLAQAILRVIESGLAPEGTSGIVISGFTQTDLADLAGISRESVSAVIKQFKASGIVSSERERLTIHDIEAIEALAHRRIRDRNPFAI